MSDLIHRIAFHGADHQPDSPSVECQHLSVSYAAIGGRLFAADSPVDALAELSFQVKEGEQIAVIGPNGAGKSTLFKVLAGILKPDSGQIQLFGNPPEEHICIAYVSQRNQIDWSFPATVADVVMMGRTRQIGLFRRPRKKDWEIVYQALEQVDAAHLAKKQIGELSGGQQQRVFIARALALETDLLLLDEPLSGLDLPSQNALFEILDTLRPEEVTVLVATHDLNVAARHFDRIMLLNRHIIAFGPADEVLTTENLLAAYGGLSPHQHPSPNTQHPTPNT
ncbi:MAG: metal ABC transporter ATP-binding protein [Ardenticatenaceae bacterium]|nr:metal ABC transporter ATP-binding protein [Ardenticatenaceae bacterium]